MASYKSKVKMATQTIKRVEVKKNSTSVDIDFGFNVTETGMDVTTTHLEFHHGNQCNKCDLKPPPKVNKKPWFAELDLSFLPFNVPKDDPDAEKLNDILNYSIEQQKEFDITDHDGSGMIAIILHRCFQALSLNSSVVYGWRWTHKETRYPHIWVTVKEYHVDNTWLDLCKVRAKYLQGHYPKCYNVEMFDEKLDQKKLDKKMTSGCCPGPSMGIKTEKCADSRDMSDYLRKRRIEYYANFPDHALALCLNREQSYYFYFAMIRYMFDKHRVSIKGIDPLIRYNCWKCGVLPKGCRVYLSNLLSDMDNSDDESDAEEGAPIGVNWRFKQCPRCMVASYCSKKCQDEDWKTLHSINCLSKGASYLLGDNPFMA